MNLIQLSFITILWWGSIAGNSFDATEIWKTDYETALSQAKKEHKTVMLYFSGSDWCKPCILLRREIFDTETFQEYAKGNLVSVKLDFPRLKKNKLSKEQIQQNEALANRFNHEGAFPSVVFLDTDEHVIEKSGYRSGGPEEYVSYVVSVLNRESK
jgi:thioredoxin-related protein